MTHIDDAAHLENALHVRAKELLTVNKLTEAWLTLLSFNH